MCLFSLDLPMTVGGEQRERAAGSAVFSPDSCADVMLAVSGSGRAQEVDQGIFLRARLALITGRASVGIKKL